MNDNRENSKPSTNMEKKRKSGKKKRKKRRSNNHFDASQINSNVMKQNSTNNEEISRLQPQMKPYKQLFPGYPMMYPYNPQYMYPQPNNQQLQYQKPNGQIRYPSQPPYNAFPFLPNNLPLWTSGNNHTGSSSSSTVISQTSSKDYQSSTPKKRRKTKPKTKIDLSTDKKSNFNGVFWRPQSRQYAAYVNLDESMELVGVYNEELNAALAVDHRLRALKMLNKEKLNFKSRLERNIVTMVLKNLKAIKTYQLQENSDVSLLKQRKKDTSSLSVKNSPETIGFEKAVLYRNVSKDNNGNPCCVNEILKNVLLVTSNNGEVIAN